MSSPVEMIYTACSNRYVRAAVVLIIAVFVVIESFGGRNDLDIFLAASGDLFRGKNIYLETYFDGYHYYYSLFFATLLYPLSLLPIALSKAFWISLNLVFLWRIIRITEEYIGSEWKKKGVMVLLVMAVFFTLRFIRGNLHFGQMTILILWLALEAIRKNDHQRPLAAACLMAIAINFKLLPLVFIPYWIYRKSWTAALSTLGFCVIFYVLPALWLGWARNTFLFEEWWKLINPVQAKHILDIEETSFHGLTTLCATLFSADAREHNGMEARRHLADLSLDQIRIITYAIRLLLIAFTLWFLRSKPFVRLTDKLHIWWEISYLFLLIPLIFPHQQHYAFMMSWPAVVYMLCYFLETQERGVRYKMRLSAMIFTGVCFNLSLYFGAGNAYYNHYKILTWGSLVLLVLLACTLPASIRKTSAVERA